MTTNYTKNNRIEYRKQLEQVLSTNRLEHSLGVEYTAASLAMRYGMNVEQAAIAGLLHDCAKYLTTEEKISLAEEHSIPISVEERNNPELLHAKLGAIITRECYNIDDEEILSSIHWHTTGHPGMTMLEKIIYIADYIEPSRNHIPDLDLVRQTAFINIDQCLVIILEKTIQYLDSTNKVIDPITRETYEYYCKNNQSLQ